MELERIIAALSPTDVVGRAPVEIADLAYDTRAVRSGALFFCVRGERADGHDFAGEAVARGAVALVVERALPGVDVRMSMRAYRLAPRIGRALLDREGRRARRKPR